MCNCGALTLRELLHARAPDGGLGREHPRGRRARRDAQGQPQQSRRGLTLAWARAQRFTENSGLNDWSDHGCRETNRAPIALTAGERYPIRLEFYENGGDARVSLAWSSASQTKQVIPAAQLVPAQ